MYGEVACWFGYGVLSFWEGDDFAAEGLCYGDGVVGALHVADDYFVEGFEVLEDLGEVEGGVVGVEYGGYFGLHGCVVFRGWLELFCGGISCVGVVEDVVVEGEEVVCEGVVAELLCVCESVGYHFLSELVVGEGLRDGLCECLVVVGVDVDGAGASCFFEA